MASRVVPRSPFVPVFGWRAFLFDLFLQNGANSCLSLEPTGRATPPGKTTPSHERGIFSDGHHLAARRGSDDPADVGCDRPGVSRTDPVCGYPGLVAGPLPIHSSGAGNPGYAHSLRGFG